MARKPKTPEPEEPEGPRPRSTYELIGHEAAEASLAAALSGGRLHHGWLITGPEGLGKETLAWRFIRRVLALHQQQDGLFGAAAPATGLGMDPEDPLCKRIEAGGHADLLVIGREFNTKTKRLRAEITAEQSRALGGFFARTSGEGGWRVALIDEADRLNNTAANAILKILEEPPPRCLIVLLSPSPERLLPTIRSRCRTLKLRPLPAEAMHDYLGRQRPELGAGARDSLMRLAEGRPGYALRLADAGADAIYAELLKLAGGFPRLDRRALLRQAGRFARAESEAEFLLWMDLLRLLVMRLVRHATGALEDPADERERHVFDAALAAVPALDRWVRVWENLNDLVRRTEGLYLDRRQAFLSAFLTLQGAATDPAP